MYHCNVTYCSFFGIFCFLLIICFFFFKQKTAYEMRISDWSSDVCSSDLRDAQIALNLGKDIAQRGRYRHSRWYRKAQSVRLPRPVVRVLTEDNHLHRVKRGGIEGREQLCTRRVNRYPACTSGAQEGRSAGHTSELQPLMRIPYAGCCLTQKKTQKTSE